MFQLVQDFATVCHPSDSLPKSVWQSMPQGQWRKLPLSMGSSISWTEIAMDHNLSHLSAQNFWQCWSRFVLPPFLPFLSLFLPSLSCFSSSLLSFKHYAGRFFPPPAPISQQFPAPTPVPRLGRSHVRKGASDTSISSAQGHQSQQRFQGHDEQIKRTPMSSYCEPRKRNCNERNCWNRLDGWYGWY